MPVDLITKVGIALHGADWQSPLARDLGVSGRLVRYWVSGARPVPNWVAEALPGIVSAAISKHQADIERLKRLQRLLSNTRTSTAA